MSNIYKVKRIDPVGMDEVYEVTVLAKDEKHAEKCARINFIELKKAKLKVEKIEIDCEIEYILNTKYLDETTHYYFLQDGYIEK